MKIVVHNPLGTDEEALQQIGQTAPNATVVDAPSERLADELTDAEIFFGYHTPEVFADAKQLKWIQSQAAGMDVMIDEAVASRGLLITNASGVHAPQVAEAAWALTFAIARGLPTYFKQQQEHVWEWTTLQDLDGATAGIIGLGGIGRRFAQTAHTLGMRVIAVDAHQPPQPDFVESLWPLERLSDLLGQSDVVLVACPYTPETHDLLDESRLRQMKSTGILINIARGGIINEQALCEVLRSGHLAGAGLDVTEVEPLPSDSPLWDTPRLVITPHCAGISPKRGKRLVDFFCENLRRYLSGEPLQNVVDQQKGYPVPGS